MHYLGSNVSVVSENHRHLFHWNKKKFRNICRGLHIQCTSFVLCNRLFEPVVSHMIFKVSANQKLKVPMVAILFTGSRHPLHFLLVRDIFVEDLIYGTLFVLIQKVWTLLLLRRRFLKFQPIRNRNFPWQPCFS